MISRDDIIYIYVINSSNIKTSKYPHIADLALTSTRTENVKGKILGSWF